MTGGPSALMTSRTGCSCDTKTENGASSATQRKAAKMPRSVTERSMGASRKISCGPLNSIRDNIRNAVNPCQHCICFRIIGKFFVITHKFQHTAKTIRNIGQMRKCSRIKAFVGIAVKVLVLSRAYCIDKIGPMIATPAFCAFF